MKKYTKGFAGLGALFLLTAGSAQAAVQSAVPPDLAASEAVVTGDVVAIGAVLIAIALTVMGVRKVTSIAR